MFEAEWILNTSDYVQSQLRLLGSMALNPIFFEGVPTKKYSNSIITSQRGSTWHCYIGRWLSRGKILLSTSRPGKTHEYFKTKLERTNSPNLVQISYIMAPQ